MYTQTKYLDALNIRNGAHLSTVLSFYSSFRLAHVEGGVIHPKVHKCPIIHQVAIAVY